MDNDVLTHQGTLAGEALTDTAETPTTEQAETQTDGFKLKVVYDGNEQELDKESARTYAQKGMNYDRETKRREEAETAKKEAETRLKELENSEIMRFAKEFSEANGQEINQAARSLRVNNYANRNNISVEEAKKRISELDEKRAEKAKLQKLENEVTQYKTEKEQREMYNAQISEIRQKYPELDLQEMPDKVGELVRSGMKLIDAYEQVTEVDRLKSQLATLEGKAHVEEVNNSNSAASPGKVGGGAPVQGDLSEELIARMTPQQLNDNHEKIATFYGWR